MRKGKRTKAWEGRLGKKTDPVFEVFNASTGFDKRLLLADVRLSRAWARALGGIGVLSSAELRRLDRALTRVEREARKGDFPFEPGDEDVHMAVERRLSELAGPAGEKIHTGRSRNDQVVTDTRLQLRDEVRTILQGIHGLQTVLIDRAAEELRAGTVLAAMTHLQPAQPVLLSHYLLSLLWGLERDRGRLVDAMKRMDEMPLGSGALAGTGFPVDRRALARELGFSAPTPNSMDAVSDRDGLAEVGSALALLLVRLSRHCEDLILWSTPRFGYVELSDALSTGSSLMPQKKNPDPLELIRGKAAGAITDAAALMVMMKGLPLTYNKDLQEDKPRLFALLDAAGPCLEVFRRVVATLTFHRGRMAEDVDETMLATEVADYLVRKGVPFRRAHEAVGRLVRISLETGTSLERLPLGKYKKVHPRFEEDVRAVFDVRSSLEARNVEGGTGPAAVRKQLQKARRLLARHRGKV